jgi:hypothetical protein
MGYTDSFFDFISLEYKYVGRYGDGCKVLRIIGNTGIRMRRSLFDQVRSESS